MALHMQELRAGRTARVVFRTQVDNNEGDNARLDEGMRVVTRAVVTQAEVCETEEDEIIAPEASGGEEGSSPEMQEATSTSPLRQPPGSQKIAALYFVYSFVHTVISVYTALAAESFSCPLDIPLCDKNVVFGISAVLEASGLAFGVFMSIRHYVDASGWIEWSDTLIMPHLIALEGMLGEGEKGRTLFLVGLEGSVCVGIIGVISLMVVSIRDEVGARSVSCSLLVVFSYLGSLALIRNRRDNVRILFLSVFGYHMLVFTLVIEVRKASYLISPDYSVLNCTVTIINAVAIVPLFVVTIGVAVGCQLCSYILSRGPPWNVPASGVDTTQAIDPDRLLSFGVTFLVKINVLDPRAPCFPSAHYAAIPGDETTVVSSIL